MSEKYDSLQEKYDYANLKCKKIDKKYQELKSNLLEYETNYKTKNQELLKEIEYLKDLVKNQLKQK